MESGDPHFPNDPGVSPATSDFPGPSATQPDETAHERAPRCVAFMGARRLAVGNLEDVALAVKALVDQGESSPVLVFDDTTSQVIDLDLRGTADDVRQNLATLIARGARPAVAQERERSQPRGPGRPRLGVVAREVTLLPRHWEWLNTQPGGASAALRRLVDQARRANAGRDRLRWAQEAAYRFMSAMAGDEPGFEEATRALFAGRSDAFDALVDRWPADVRDHARTLAGRAFAEPPGSNDATGQEER
jgi:uncharacterized protein